MKFGACFKFPFVLVVLSAHAYLFAQTNESTNTSLSLYQKEVILATDSLSLRYALPDSFLIPELEKVWSDSILLAKSLDYTIDYIHGVIILKQKSRGKTLRIQYEIFPFSLQTKYFHQKLTIVSTDSEKTNGGDGATGENGTQSLPKPVSQNLLPNSQLRKSGSIVRGVSVGTNQGLQVDSGLRMQISGRLADKVDVVASLTDQNTPIQPEGNTQTLQEIDKVFVQLRGPNMQATLGDYNLDFQGTEFTRYSRKLQGVMGQGNFQNASVTLSGAVSRGQFTTNEFTGQEGIQGPYQLHASNGQINIIILAGTERVWVDGELMTRGENNDYVIEYANGQITFTRHRLITADSRIVVDFQFSDESFQRNFWAVRGESKMLNDKLKLGTTFIRESDDRNNPLSINLSDDVLASLEAAGDGLAITRGDTLVGEGKGAYIKDSTDVFVYVGPNSGNYNVAFSFFGENQGDYRNIGLGRFEFVGENKGSYRPFVILPKAQQHDVVGFNFDYAPASFFDVQSELALSQFDANVYSGLDDGDNHGGAYSVKLNFAPDKLHVGGKNLGKLSFTGLFRNKAADFREIDRTTIAEFNRRWNIPASISTAQENIREFNGKYEPTTGLTFQGGVGHLSKSSLFKSNRWEAQTAIQKKYLPNIDYFVEFIDRDDQNINQQSTWLRQQGHAEIGLKFVKPIFQYEGEIKKDSQRDTSQTGFRFDSYTGGLQVSPWKSMNASVQYNLRDDKDRAGEFFQPKSLAKTQSYAWSLRNWHAINATASYTHRDRNFADANVQDVRTDLADLRLGYAPRHGGVRSNLYYQISNTRVARQEEVYIEVEEGQGNFRFNEDLNEYEPDPFGNFVRRLFSTNDFIPVVQLQMRTDLRLAPGRFFEAKNEKPSKKGFLQKLLSPLSTETFVRIDERTTEKDVAKIYLLNLAYFQQDSTTIFGSIEFRQDMYLWENSRKFSLRYRYRNRNELNNQFIDGGQDREVREQSLRTLYQFSNQISTQFEFMHSEEDRIFQSLAREDRKIRSNRLQLDLVYRPQPKLEIGLKSEFSLNKDIVPTPQTNANLFSFKPRTNYSINNKGRIRAEIEWTNVTVSPKNRLIPFELTDGNRNGATFRWNLGFDYRVADNVQATINYFGRNEPDRPKTQHIAKVEMRAFF